MLSDKCDIRYKMFGISRSQKNESRKHLFHHRHTELHVIKLQLITFYIILSMPT